MSSDSFQRVFGVAAVTRTSAPGRVNLIGEHTDYNGGFVLPTAIPQRTRVELAARTDRRVRAFSVNVSGPDLLVEYDLGDERRQGTWCDYLQGVTWVLQQEGFAIGGADVRVESTVPLGSGLSSSASLLVALLRAFRDAWSLDLADVPLARLAKRAENDLVGAPVGIMDQMACSLVGDRQALFLDARSLDYTIVDLPSDVELIVINSGIAHQHAGGDYRTRRAECERAAAALGVSFLREVESSDLPRAMNLPEPLGRRVRHVVGEDARVLAAVRAIEDGDVATLGRLFHASHDSMRDDYEVSVPEVDVLVDLGREDPEVFGARLTGGGFGGSVVMLAHPGAAARAAARIRSEYERRTGRQGTVLVP